MARNTVKTTKTANTVKTVKTSKPAVAKPAAEKPAVAQVAAETTAEAVAPVQKFNSIELKSGRKLPVRVAKSTNAFTSETGDFRYNSKMTDKEADAAIASLRKSGLQLKKLAHETACNIAMHYEATGDYRKMDALAAAIREGMGGAYARNFISWVETFCSLVWVEEAPASYNEKKHGKYQPCFRHVANHKFINKAGGMKGFFDQAALDVPFFVGGFVEADQKPQALSADKVQSLILNAVKRLVALEVEKHIGKEIGSGKEKQLVQINHEVDDGLVADLLKVLQKHNVPTGDLIKKASDDGLKLSMLH